MLGASVILVLMNLLAAPAYFGCIHRDYNWLKPMGRAHCTLEAWRTNPIKAWRINQAASGG